MNCKNLLFSFIGIGICLFPITSVSQTVSDEKTRPKERAANIDPSFSWVPKKGEVSYGSITSRSGAEPVLLTIGTGTAAGYRDGGLFRAGQLTSYPNLVARQMGLTSFSQPLFGEDIADGTGYLNGDVRKGWEKITERAAFKTNVKVSATLANNTALIHNFSAPGNHPNLYLINPNYLYQRALNKGKAFIVEEDNSSPNLLWSGGQELSALTSRLVPETYKNVWEYLDGINPNIAIIDVNTDVYVQAHINGGQAGLSGTRENYWEVEIIKFLKKKGAKYLFATTPDILEFPYFKAFQQETMPQVAGKDVRFLKDGSAEINAIPAGSILLPTNSTRNLFDGLFNSEDYLLDADVITPDEISRPQFLNEYIVALSREYGHPVVDFYSIYKSILKGTYTSDDGTFIDPSYPSGNFFSKDGLYPSAVGQAVLANEVLKVINKSFGANVPLINIGQYQKEITKINN